MPASPEQPVLVTGATGTQGGATAKALLATGRRVRCLCRNPAATAAQSLAEAGAEIVAGDLDDFASIESALHGVAGVFSIQVPDIRGIDSERRHGLALVSAAHAAGVPHFVHTSVTANGKHAGFPRWGAGYWNEKYWTDKWAVEHAVVSAGFPCWTVLRPAFIMENFLPPKVSHMFPGLPRGELVTALHAETRMQLIAGDDIGAFACAAFNSPATFSGKTIELAVEGLTMAQIATILSRVLGKTITAASVPPEHALKRGLMPGWVRTQEFRNEVGYHVDIDALKPWGIALTPFESWARKHRSDFLALLASGPGQGT